MRISPLDTRDMPGNRYMTLVPMWIDTRPEFDLPVFPVLARVIDPWYPELGLITHATMFVPKGFTFDKASIPAAVRGLLSEDTERASAPHDLICRWLYYMTVTPDLGDYPVSCSRLFGDRIYRAVCKHDGVSWWRRNLMFHALVLNTARQGFPGGR